MNKIFLYLYPIKEFANVFFLGNEYYDALAQLNCDSNLSGRVTMQMHYALSEPFVATDDTPINHVAFYKAVDSTQGYNIALDSKGRLRWSDTTPDEQPLLVITSV